jgi:hypothetical protein
MSAHPPRRAPQSARQRGQAMLLTVLLLGVGVSAVVYNFVAPAKQSIERDRITVQALAQAKDALIGYAAADNRPGSLPCPDGTNSGVAGSPIPTDCPGYVSGNVYVGRLPWRSLHLPDLRDGYGERLWYAVSREYARNSSTCGSCPLNSDTPGQLTITGGPSGVIAIVFSPGAVVGSQVRDTPNENNVSHYLEGGNQLGITTNTFVNALATATFNDKLLPITREALFPVVEMRVARELRLTLRSYYTANGYYPYAASFPGYASTPNTYRGYIPATISTCVPAPGIADPLTAVPGGAAGWFIANNWHQVMVYAVAPRCTPKITSISEIHATPPACALSCGSGPPYTCDMPSTMTIDASVLNCVDVSRAFLTVTGISSTIESLVLPASYRLGAQPARPCSSISDCLESVGADNQNIDSPDNYQYVKPVRSSGNNDSLVIVSP